MGTYTVEIPRNEKELAAFVHACDEQFEREMQQRAEKIASKPSLRLLGLTGPTCSGKTTAAKRLIDCLEAHGHRVHLISIDDFYYDKEILEKRAEEDPNIEIDYDSEETINIDLLAEKTQSLLAGNTTCLPRFDFQTGKSRCGVVITPQEGDVFLFEGIQVLYPRVNAILNREGYRCICIAPTEALRIGDMVYDPNEIRLMRRLVRDYRYRSSNPAFTFYLWKSVRENEEKHIFPHLELCHYFINSTMPYEIGMLRPYLEEILSEISSDDPSYEEAQRVLSRIAHVPPIPSELMKENSLYKEFI